MKASKVGCRTGWNCRRKGAKHTKGLRAFRPFRPFVVLELTTPYYASGQPIATRMDSTQRPFGFWKPEGSVLADQGQRLC